MSDNKKKRLSMLDNLAAAGAPTPSSMMATSRPLRAARDAVDGHKVWELNPEDVIDTRVADRLSHADVADLRESIEATGQTVPILVRRHPSEAGKYLLVYGRRRLEAIRTSDKVTTVRALIANMDDTAAVEAQVSENMARRDLSYIEKALFAHELIESGFGTQIRVAEVLTVTKSSVSMALSVVEAIGADLIRAIGPAHGVGRPRWDALARALEGTLVERPDLLDIAERTHAMSSVDVFSATNVEDIPDPSVQAFEAVLEKVQTKPAPKAKKAKAKGPAKTTTVTLPDGTSSKVARTARGLRMDVGQGGFADWLEAEAQTVLTELHQRWQQRGEET